MNGENLNLSQERVEPGVSHPMDLDTLGTESNLCFRDLDSPRQHDDDVGGEAMAMAYLKAKRTAAAKAKADALEKGGGGT